MTGGGARNPITELCQLISECYDVRKGQIRIPGFYDDAAKLSKKELDNFLASGFTTKQFKRAHELKKMREGGDADIASRLWARPTFEVHGIVGGYTGPGVKTAIPYKAEAKISMRLVPNQDADRIVKLVKAFVKERNPDVQVIPESVLRPYVGPHSGPYADAARDAMRTAFGKDPAFVREGGSIGVSGSQPSGARLSCPERKFRLGAGVGRDANVCPVFRVASWPSGEPEASLAVRSFLTTRPSRRVSSREP